MVHARLTLVVLALLGASCAPVTPPSSVGIETIAPATVAPATDAATPTAGAMGEIQVTELNLAGQGDTLLARIDAALRELGTPEEHRYVELDDSAGGRWQGEALIYPDRQVLLLQPVQGGGRTTWQIEAPLAARAQVLLDALPSVTAEAPPPDVEVQFVRARLTGSENGMETWSFDVTLAHPDTGWEDYADGWQVVTPEEIILGTRILLHPHVEEQPFTRSLGGVAVPAGMDEVVVRPHDLVSGYGSGLRVPLAQPSATAQVEVIR